jgi:tetratricopeptide (TPR) repeat protein
VRYRYSAVIGIVVALSLGMGARAFADAYQEAKDLYKAKNYAGALAKFQEAIRQAPHKAKLHWRLGLTYLKLKNGPAAAAAFAEAQRLDPAIGFTERSKFDERLARARAMAGMGTVAPPPAVGTSPVAPPVGGPARARLFPEDLLNQVAADLMGTRQLVKDYAGMIAASDLSRIQEVVSQAGAAGYAMRVVFMPATYATRLQSFTTQVYQFMKGGPKDIVVIATPRGANAEAGAIKRADMQRILVANKAQFAISYGQGLYAIASDIAKVVGIKAARAESKKRVWIWVGVGVGGLILLIIVIAVVKRSRRKAEEMEAYKREYEQAVEMMGPVADKLGNLQLSVQIVDDEDARMFVKRAEANYFGAQGLLNRIPAPGKGEPDFKGVRRLAGQLHEADQALEKADMIVSRKLGGKPVDLKQIEAQGGKKFGCYFCSRPLRDESAGQVVGLEIKGQKMDVLACHSCYEEYQGGKQPKVRMVEYEGRPVHWSMVPGYDPWYDYYHYDRFRATWVDAFVLATIFDWALWHAHPSPYVMWYPPGVYHWPSTPVYYNADTYARDQDVDAVIGSSWSSGGAPSGIEFAGPEGGGIGGADVS